MLAAAAHRPSSLESLRGGREPAQPPACCCLKEDACLQWKKEGVCDNAEKYKEDDVQQLPHMAAPPLVPHTCQRRICTPARLSNWTPQQT